MTELKNCPFCGEKPWLQLTDSEGNFRSLSYLDEPYSGEGYVLLHIPNKCPIGCNKGEPLGQLIYDTETEAIQAWNTRHTASLSDEAILELALEVGFKEPDYTDDPDRLLDFARAVLAASVGSNAE